MMIKSQKGFSLIELMVVVSIIAVLAAIAIPRVNRFVAKSRTSEAQVNLSSLYTFNKNFYVEYQGYTPYFGAMGYVPEGRLRYNVGWAAGANNCPAAYTAIKGACTGTPAGSAISSDGYCGVLGGSAGIATPDTCDIIPGPGSTGAEALAGTSCLDGAFVASARAKLIDGTDIDTWTINQDKNLINTNDGTDGF